MANKEVYDYLLAVSPDNNETLSVRPQKALFEGGEMNQVVHIGDDDSEQRISLGDDSPIFHLRCHWDHISKSESGTIFDFYFDSTKGNGIKDSFKLTHPTDGHTYVVRFASKMERVLMDGEDYGISELLFKVLGRIND